MLIARRAKARPSGLAFSMGLLLLLAACTSDIAVPFADRAETLARQHGWQSHHLGNSDFAIAGYSRPFTSGQDLTVYIEGDGRAWLSKNRLSPDPTPLQPYALRLAVRHPQGNVAYVARPCQYTRTVSRACHVQYWSSHRYAPEILVVMDQAVDQLKVKSGAGRIRLVGFSGGGTVAALLSFIRDDVTELITISANLDHEYWTNLDGSSPLHGSSNAADIADSISHIPQRHFVGLRDEIVPPKVADSFLSRIHDPKNARIVKLEGFDHNCCWVDHWPAILGR